MKNQEIIDDILIVKVGTSTLVPDESVKNGDINQENFNLIGEQLKQQQELGRKIIVVSSGAISAGMVETGLKERPNPEIKKNLPELQRLASIGWRTVTNMWNEALSPNHTPDILITNRELGHTQEKKKLLRMTKHSLENNDVIISNENDAISTKEIVFGDNDKLSATFAKALGESSMFGSNIKLILLTDVDGFCKDPDDETTLIPVVYDILDFFRFAKETTNEEGKGGMISKLEAYQIAKSANIDMWIANGSDSNAIEKALNGETGTYFPAKS